MTSLDLVVKTCTACGVEKGIDEFTRRNGRCRPCRAAYARAYYQSNPEKVKEASRKYARLNPEKVKEVRRRHYAKNHEQIIGKRHFWKLKYGYGITVEQYDEMLATQNGVCAICFESNPDGSRLAVDHNHTTRVIRGLLCARCNKGVGLLRERSDLLTNAMLYLSYPPQRVPMGEVRGSAAQAR